MTAEEALYSLNQLYHNRDMNEPTRDAHFHVVNKFIEEVGTCQLNEYLALDKSKKEFTGAKKYGGINDRFPGLPYLNNH